MNTLNVFVALVLVWCSVVNGADDEEALFSSFVAKHQKEYYLKGNRTEYLFRFEIFKKNLKYIEDYNSQNTETTLGITFYTDMTNTEFASNRKKLQMPYSHWPDVHSPHVSDLPDSFNWQDKNVVGSVKNTGNCGNTIIYAMVDSVSSIYAIQSGAPYAQLDPTEVSSCSSGGCTGGTPNQVLTYIMVHGLSYNCPRTKVPNGVCIKGGQCALMGNETDLAVALTTKGPLFVSIDGSSQDFQLYTGGIYGPKGCSTQNLDTSLLLIGFTDNYWICQNSWGVSWGIQGYVWIARNGGNTCGIASAGCHPTGVSKC